MLLTICDLGRSITRFSEINMTAFSFICCGIQTQAFSATPNMPRTTPTSVPFKSRARPTSSGLRVAMVISGRFEAISLASGYNSLMSSLMSRPFSTSMALPPTLFVMFINCNSGSGYLTAVMSLRSGISNRSRTFALYFFNISSLLLISLSP